MRKLFIVTNQNKKLAKVLAATIFGVGFVTPLMFSNITEAATKNFGVGGTVQLLSDAQLKHQYTSDTDNSSGEYSKWAKDRTYTGSNYSGNLTNDNCVVVHGVKFKIVAVDDASEGQNAKVTLYSYETDGTKFASATGADANGKVNYNANGYWGASSDSTENPEQAYARSNLMTAMDSMYEKVFENDYRIQPVALKYNDETNEKNTDGSDLSSKYVWAPGTVELGTDNTGAASGAWQLTEEQRAGCDHSWLRSPDLTDACDAYNIYSSGGIYHRWSFDEDYGLLLRPALQILNQTSCVFTTNVAIPRNGVFKADDSSGTNYAPYTLNSDAVKPTFAPATNGVTLDGTKIGITTTASTTDDEYFPIWRYVTTGLLTEEADSTKNDTWANLNGTTANIAYMAQVSSNELDLSGVATDTDYTLKIFGLKKADTTVTELADNAVNGLSIVDGKIHMKVSSTINNGVGVTLKNGAVLDLVGNASNAITVSAKVEGTNTGEGMLNMGANDFTGKITNAGTLIVDATTGSLAPGALSENIGILELKGGTLAGAIANTGTVKLNGATLGGAHVTAGTLEFAQNLTTNANYVAASTNTVDSGVTLTLTAGTLDKTVTNSGTVKVDAVTGTVTVAQNINGGILNVVSGLMAYTGSEVIGSTTVVKSGAKLDPSASLLNTSTTVEEGGSLYLSGGTLGVDIQGKGTTYLKSTPDASSGATVTVDTTRNVAGTLDLNGGTLDMQGSNTLNKLTVGTLSGTGNIKFDAVINGSEKPSIDNIEATNVAENTKLTLNSVNMTGSSTLTEWALGAAKTVVLVTSTSGIANLTIEGTATAASNGYRYVFSQNAAGSGEVKIVKGIGGTLAQIVQNENVGGYDMGNIPTYALVDNYTETSNLDILTRVVSATPREFAINGNDNKFAGGSNKGIEVKSGDTLNLTNIREISDWNTYAVKNAGTVNISTNGTTKLESILQGTGTYNLTGGTLKVEDLRYLAMTGITNNGTMELGNKTVETADDILAATITGGAVKVIEDVSTEGGKLVAGTNDTLVVSDGKTLTITGGDLARNVTWTTGTTKFTGTSESKATIANKLDVAGGTLTINADNIDGTGNTVTDGILKLNGGQLDKEVTGAGTTEIIADTELKANLGTAIKVGASKKLTSAANNIGGEVDNKGTVELTGNTLSKTITGGVLNITGDVTSAADNIAGATNTIADNKTLTLTAGTLSKDVINNGTVKLNGATMDGAHVTTGTLEFAKDISLDVSYVAAPTNIVDSNVTLTLTGAYKTLVQTVSGAGKVVVDGIISADADKFSQAGGVEVQDTLAFTSRGLNVAAVGGFKQAAGSNVTVDASKIQADSNDPNQALFTGVDVADKLNVSAGKLTLTGAVQDGKYYVLVAGTAVNSGTVSDATLWKMDNISFPDILMADYEIKYDTNTADNPGSIALHVTNATTKEEGNTSGLAAVQQGNITVAKEISDEVVNRLSFVQRPSLLQKMQAKVRDVANTNKDDYKVETVEQGKANEVMPVQLAEKDKYDKEVWASHIRTKETTEGMKLGAGVEGNNTAQYNGAVVGVDFYTSRKAITGVAFSYTTGDIDSYSGNTFTRNKSKYYGVSFYDRVTNGNTALIYDIGYIRGDNDISQFYNKETTSDVKTDTYTAGVRYEAEFGTEKSRVVPFASFRYMRQNNKNYTNSHNTRFETKNQNLYIPKVGIAWTGDFAMPQCEWTWRPSVEAGYVWNLGDRSAESMVYAGTLVSPIDYDVVDRSSYYAKAGMEFMTKNFTAGLFYRYLKGNAVRNNKWNVNMSWSF